MFHRPRYSSILRDSLESFIQILYFCDSLSIDAVVSVFIKTNVTIALRSIN